MINNHMTIVFFAHVVQLHITHPTKWKKNYFEFHMKQKKIFTENLQVFVYNLSLIVGRCMNFMLQWTQTKINVKYLLYRMVRFMEILFRTFNETTPLSLNSHCDCKTFIFCRIIIHYTILLRFLCYTYLIR